MPTIKRKKLTKTQRLIKRAKVKQEPKHIWNSAKRSWFNWGNNQVMKLQLRGAAKTVLETIIRLANLNRLSQATNQTILKSHNSRHAKISRATLYRYLIVLERHKLIKRYNQYRFYSVGIIEVLAAKLLNLCVSKRDTNNISSKKGHLIEEKTQYYDPNLDPNYLERLKKLFERQT